MNKNPNLLEKVALIGGGLLNGALLSGGHCTKILPDIRAIGYYGHLRPVPWWPL